MSQARQCDVCEKYYKKTEESAYMHNGIPGVSTSSAIDVCSECCNLLAIPYGIITYNHIIMVMMDLKKRVDHDGSK